MHQSSDPAPKELLSKEQAIGNPNKKSAKKIEEQKEKRLATTKRGKLEKRADRRDARHD